MKKVGKYTFMLSNPKDRVELCNKLRNDGDTQCASLANRVELDGKGSDDDKVRIYSFSSDKHDAYGCFAEMTQGNATISKASVRKVRFIV